MQCLRKRAHATPRPTPGTPPPSRQRSRGRCRPRLPEGPGRGSPRPRPTAPTGHLGALGSRARGLPGSPAPPCPVGCFWLGPEKGHCHLCPPGTLEADETHQRGRQGHGAARRKRRPVRPGLGSPLLIGETGTRGAVTPGGPAAVGPAQAPEDTSPNMEPHRLSAQRMPTGPVGQSGQGTEAYAHTTQSRPHTLTRMYSHSRSHAHTYTD